MSTILLIYTLFTLTLAQIENDNLKRNSSGFLFTMPNTLQAGKNETVCISGHYMPVKIAQVVVDLKIKTTHFYTTHAFNTDSSCFTLHVSDIDISETHFVSVKIELHINGGVLYSHNQDPVLIYPRKKITFIETDKLTYKSEDKIKIRILTLGHDLLPDLNYKVPQVRIQNPMGLGVVVWQNISTESGLAHLEHQLSTDPIEGKWKIEANGETQVFEVAKYILPRFKVDIYHSQIVYWQTPTVSVKVCAKYSYGGLVKGTAFIKIIDSNNLMKPRQLIQKMSTGCAVFSFSNEDLSLSVMKETFSTSEQKIYLHFTATVTEYGTDKIEITTSKCLVTLKPYDLKIVRKTLLHPTLPYHGVIQFNNIQTQINGEAIEICYSIAIRKSWNYLNTEQCSNFTIADKTLPFHILPLKNSVIHLQLHVRSLNHSNIEDSLLVVRLYSQSSMYLTLEQNNTPAKCRSLQQFTVQYTADKFREGTNHTFYYIIKTRNQILKLGKRVNTVAKEHLNYSDYKNIVGSKHKHVKNNSIVGKFMLKFRLNDNVISNYNILVYYINEEGEVISATREVYIEPCLNNKVLANWSHRHITPSGTASLLVQTKSDSLCSITATDKAVKFMDDFNSLDIKSFFKPLLKHADPAESGRKSCIAPTKKNRDAASIQEAPESMERRKRYVYPFSEDYDAYDIFNNFGTIVITNFRIITKPCYAGPVDANNPAQALTDYDAQNEDTVPSIRSYFPETWLWELIPVRGAAVIHRDIPQSITTWLTNVLCVSNTDGVGFSKTIEISSYQPFFVDVLVPYSIKTGEVLYLNVMIFNYLHHNIPVKINFTTSSNFEIINKQSRIFSYCVPGNNSVTHIFEVKALSAGEGNLTVFSELDAGYPGQCGPEVVVNKRDAVFKKVVIEPEGYRVQTTKSALLCASDTLGLSNISWNLKVSEQVVLKTAVSKIVVNADIIGPTLENLEDLIIMPTGCGEQIMANLVPNLYIMKYLNATRDLNQYLKRRIIRNLKIGYQRILSYVHKDGSFSAFGYHDPMGSMFLTAFVVRTLQEIRQYIYVDQRILDRAIKWILNHQLENGCFNTMLHVFQDMGGTNLENSTSALTSYVMISLLDAGIEIPENVKTNAKYCIRGHYHLDKYTLAISSYALLKIHWYSEATRMLKKLFQISNTRDNMIWWTNKESGGSTASDIEITSYVLLSLMHEKTQENLAKAHSIMRWLTTKLGPKGSFQSTQDTVVALDAITRYSQFINSNELNLRVKIEAQEQHQTIAISKTNKLKSKKIVLKKASNSVTINVEGKGCILAQAVTLQYIKELKPSDAFQLEMEVMPVSNIDKCSIATLSSCFTYTGPDLQSNMAILEINLPSGYEADRMSLYNLINEEHPKKLKMFEELQQKVVLYFTKITSQQICINFNINENAIINSRRQSIVKLYDYYKPEYNTLKFYKISEKCWRKNETIPDIVNLQMQAANETKKIMKKRQLDNFVVINEELDVPGGVEGPIPAYIKYNSSNRGG